MTLDSSDREVQRICRLPCTCKCQHILTLLHRLQYCRTTSARLVTHICVQSLSRHAGTECLLTEGIWRLLQEYVIADPPHVRAPAEMRVTVCRQPRASGGDSHWCGFRLIRACELYSWESDLCWKKTEPSKRLTAWLLRSAPGQSRMPREPDTAGNASSDEVCDASLPLHMRAFNPSLQPSNPSGPIRDLDHKLQNAVRRRSQFTVRT